MYLDHALFGAAAALLAVAVLTAVMIFRRWARWKDDEKTVREAKTERIEICETLSRTLSAEGGETTESWRDAAVHNTEKIGAWKTGKDGAALDTSALDGRYTLLKEIHEGNMSRVFLAEDVRIGNQCIVKYIAATDPRLADEAEILKRLEHLGLPQVLDVIPASQGLFLVERRVEGYSLGMTLSRMRDRLTRAQICDWGIQLAKVLSYLHGLDTPIYHCDIKPSNIMVTHDDRLVLVDLGIAQRGGTADRIDYVTFAYAAPELLIGSQKGRAYIQERFGKIPDGAPNWNVDERTDLYSVGVILYEMLTGKLPEKDTVKDVYGYGTKDLGDLIRRCLSVEPMDRPRSARELADGLEEIRLRWNGAPHRLWIRRAAIAACCAALAGSMGITASAVYLRQIEDTAELSFDPAHVAISPRQSIVLHAADLYPHGGIQDVDLDRIDWSYSQEGIAVLEEGRLMGLQAGSVTLTGKRRNKTAVIQVEVTEPVENGVEVSLRYIDGVEVSRYIGSEVRDRVDGPLPESAFVSPKSLDIDGSTLYLTDSGAVRAIRDGVVSTVSGLPAYLRAEVIKHHGPDLYILTGDWEEDDGTYRHGIARYPGVGGADILYDTESGVTTIHDLAVSSDGTILFILENAMEGTTRLRSLDADQHLSDIMALPDGSSRLVFGAEEDLYISVPTEGMIYRVKNGAAGPTPFVGGKNERNFIDGTAADLYRPTAMAWMDGTLYVLDLDTVRRVQIREDGTASVDTVAGVPVPDTAPEIRLGIGQRTVFAADNGASLAIKDDKHLFLSDPKNDAVYLISMAGASQRI